MKDEEYQLQKQIKAYTNVYYRPNKKLNVKKTDARAYNYDQLKTPKVIRKKQEIFQKMWHDKTWEDGNLVKSIEFYYQSKIDQLILLNETHYLVMKNRIMNKNWKFEYNISFGII